MRITLAISGYYDWAPVPAGTQISEEDVKSLRVKQMSDGKWHMRVECKAGENQHHSMGLHEEMLCRRLAALTKIGRPHTRAQVAAEMVRESLQHHLDAEHVLDVDVHDDGPDEALYAACLTEAGVTNDNDHARAASRYAAACDLSKYLENYLGVPAKETQ